jgi:DNA-directed RNA polymerase subunit RPC12/RpoP
LIQFIIYQDFFFCEFSCDFKDLTIVNKPDFYREYIDCPQCNTRVWIKNETKALKVKVGEVTSIQNKIDHINIKSPLDGASFHGEIWYRCPDCNESFEVHDTEFERGFTTVDKKNRIYKHNKCGCVIQII